jgi:hypothetical protein
MTPCAGLLDIAQQTLHGIAAGGEAWGGIVAERAAHGLDFSGGQRSDSGVWV